MRCFRKLLSILLMLSLLIPFAPGARAAGAGTGAAVYAYARELLLGLTYENEVSYTEKGERVETYSLRLAPDSAVKPLVVTTEPIMGDATLTDVIAAETEKGRSVLAGMNADFFSGSRVPLGAVITDGLLRTTPETEPILAFTPEGPVFLSENDLAISLLWEEGEPLSVHHLNKRLNSVGGIFLYTADFVDEEGFSLPNAWAARLKVEEGELRLGTSLTLTVAEVLDAPEDKVLLAEDELLLASNTPYFASAISHFTLGETVTLALTASDERLLSATTATGCGDLLVADGEITDPESWDKELLKTHPRTVFGLMEDGTMVFTVLDGRTAGHSVGATLAELAADLKSKGCRWAVNLDGGGSTAMAVRLPGDARAEVVNTPSIGKLRSCGTYLLFITEAEPTPAGLYLEGDGDYLLTGSSYPLTWLAYKSSLAALSPPEDVKASCTAYGTVEETVYTAGAEPGEETITLSSESTGLVGAGTLFLVDAVDELRLVNLLTGREAVFSGLQEGSELLLRPVLRLNGRPVRYDPALLTLSVTGSAATVTEEGIIAITGLPGDTGELTLTLGPLTEAIPLSVASQFTDTAGHWSRGYVEALYREGIISGVSETAFAPRASIRRGDFILMLWRALGRGEAAKPTTFTDVTEEDYWYNALSWAQEKGIARGFEDGSFRPQETLTREQAFTLLVRSFFPEEEPRGEEALAPFPDAERVSSYAKAAVALLVEKEIVSGANGLLLPKSDITRAEMAKLLCVTLYPNLQPSEESASEG